MSSQPVSPSRSDELAEPVVALYVLAAPEVASNLGLTQADAYTSDYREGWRDRIREAAFRAAETLRAAASVETDPRVAEDLAILLRAVDEVVETIDVRDAHLVELIDVARLAFTGIRVLLDEQNPLERKRLIATLSRVAGLDDVSPRAVRAAARRSP